MNILVSMNVYFFYTIWLAAIITISAKRYSRDTETPVLRFDARPLRLSKYDDERFNKCIFARRTKSIRSRAMRILAKRSHIIAHSSAGALLQLVIVCSSFARLALFVSVDAPLIDVRRQRWGRGAFIDEYKTSVRRNKIQCHPLHVVETA